MSSSSTLLKAAQAENEKLRKEIQRLQGIIANLLNGNKQRAERETATQRKLRILEMLVTKDHLTGLLNRRGFEESLVGFISALSRAIRRSNTHQSKIGTLVYIDFDRFKPVNDLFSHHTGDVMLMKIGKCLKRMVRPSDHVARLSGDEFAILLSGVGSRAQAEKIIEKIHDEIRKITIDDADEEQLELLYNSIGRRYVLEFSAGYLVVENAQLDPSHLLDLAERDVPKFAALRPKRGAYETP